MRTCSILTVMALATACATVEPTKLAKASPQTGLLVTPGGASLTRE
jgi:hypothetical protein